MIDLEEYGNLANDTGAFLDIELEIQKEALKTWEEKPGQNYFLVEIRDGKLLAGYCLYHRAANTDFTMDIHSFVVDRDYRDKGVGVRLLEMVEDELLSTMGHAILRIEISRKKESIVGDQFFAENGFEMIGHIPDFYEEGNDYYIYVRHVCPEPDEPEELESGERLAAQGGPEDGGQKAGEPSVG